MCDIAPHEAEESVSEEHETAAAAAAAAAIGGKDCGIADVDAGVACSNDSNHNCGNSDGDGEEVDAFAHDAVLLAFKVSTLLRNDSACSSSRREELNIMCIPFAPRPSFPSLSGECRRRRLLAALAGENHRYMLAQRPSR